jgi:hypothetical protein
MCPGEAYGRPARQPDCWTLREGQPDDDNIARRAAAGHPEACPVDHHAEETQRSIDQEVARLFREAEATATQLLRGHREMPDRVIDLLLERETIDGSDLAAIVGAPGPAGHDPGRATARPDDDDDPRRAAEEPARPAQLLVTGGVP